MRRSDGTWKRIREAGVQDLVSPIRAEGMSCPSPTGSLTPSSASTPTSTSGRTTYAAMLRVLLKATDKGDYDWVECGS